MRFHSIKSLLAICTTGLLIIGSAVSWDINPNGKWISLFNGKTLAGWQAADNPKTFSVQEGCIVVHGPRAHLFYTGPVRNHNFKNFEFKADVMTTEGSNSGIFFHTKFQKKGWPSKGYEVQINNTHTDPIKTASLYGIDDVKKTPVSDDEWFTLLIKVKNRKVTIKINEQTMVNHEIPDSLSRKNGNTSGGTFALQGHDPDSKVYFKNIMVRPLP